MNLLLRHRWFADQVARAWVCRADASALAERQDEICRGDCGGCVPFSKVKNPPVTPATLHSLLDIHWMSILGGLHEEDPIRLRAESDLSSAPYPPPSDPMAVARRLMEEMFTRAGYVYLRNHRGDFYRWNETSWREVDDADVRSAVYRHLEGVSFLKGKDFVAPFAPNRAKVGDVMEALRAIAIVDSATDMPLWLDGRPEPPATEIVSVKNGLLHIATRQLSAHDPFLFNGHSLPFPFEPDAPSPERWLDFLRQIWGSDESSIFALQEAVGYILAGDTRQQKIFMLVGPKRAGKGTIARVVTGLLGAHNVCAPTLAGMATNFGLAPLIGKPMAVISDARVGKGDLKIVVERLLSISGEDCLTIDRKYREPWTGRLPSRFLILTNELPKLSDSSGALASRFIVFVMTRSFFAEEDPELTDKLLKEAPGIFNWGLSGLDRFKNRGRFLQPESSREAVQQLEDLTSPISAFIREGCVVGADQRVPVDEVWKAWKSWCEDDNRHPGTKAVFGRDLRAACPAVRRHRPRGGRCREYEYQGIGLLETTVGNCQDRQDQNLFPDPSGPGNFPLQSVLEAKKKPYHKPTIRQLVGPVEVLRQAGHDGSLLRPALVVALRRANTGMSNDAAEALIDLSQEAGWLVRENGQIRVHEKGGTHQ